MLYEAVKSRIYSWVYISHGTKRGNIADPSSRSSERYLCNGLEIKYVTLSPFELLFDPPRRGESAVIRSIYVVLRCFVFQTNCTEVLLKCEVRRQYSRKG